MWASPQRRVNRPDATADAPRPRGHQRHGGQPAEVSRTSLYQNAEARALVTAASGEHSRNAGIRASSPAPAETAPWRERALNAEHELKQARSEITTQRGRIGELLGRIRDLENDLPEDGIVEAPLRRS